MKTYSFYIISIACMTGCLDPIQEEKKQAVTVKDSVISCPTPVASFADDSTVVDSVARETLNDINTRDVQPEAVVAFAQRLKGVPYKYASADPSKGFDCSGFITYVFKRFDIEVPRSSVDFTNKGREVSTNSAQPGDLILFTGTDSTIPIVGHMGIVTDNDGGNLSFIHSTSGKAYGVTVTPLEGYYKTRFVKIIRIFPDKAFPAAP